MDHLIVVLTYNHIELAQARMAELTRIYHDDPAVAIYLFDNGSTDSRYRLWRASDAVERLKGFHFGHIHANRGFAGGFNAAVASGMALLGRPRVLHLLSNDVAVGGDIARLSGAALLDNPRTIVCHRIVNWHAGWNQFASARIPYPDGYYLAMTPEIWDELGGFDEDFTPHDYEDVDLGYRAIRGGIALKEIVTLPLVHSPASTVPYDQTRREHTVRMRAIFAEKHGLTNEPEKP